MKVLVINSGSSSVKFKLYDMLENSVMAQGNCQRVGLSNSEIKYMWNGRKELYVQDLASHSQALAKVFELLTTGDTQVIGSMEEIGAVGHRISMGGSKYVNSVRIDDDVLDTADQMADLAPLHNPPQVMGIRACQELLGKEFPMVASFDTAFHQTMPKETYLFPIPYRFYEQYDLRRFGFHGLSHQFVTDRYGEISGHAPQEKRIITCHLGGGSSLTAVQFGKSVDNTFGVGTGQGMICGTRAGDFDHVGIGYLMRKEGLDYDQVEDILHRESGLKGISGLSSDEKELEDLAVQGEERAQLALAMMAKQAKKYIGGYAFVMGGLDSIIFTGGIGENSDIMRSLICQGLEQFGVMLDDHANVAFNRSEHKISTPDSKVEIWIIPTDEELVIARDTMGIVGA